MIGHGSTRPSGTLHTRVIRADRIGWSYKVRNVPNIWRGWWRIRVARALGIPTFYGELKASVLRCTCDVRGQHPGQRCPNGRWLNYGTVSYRVITDAGVAYIVDAFQNTTELENLKYHGLGTGTTAEAATQTALVTELTTEYNPNSTRATGTTAETSANIYQSVATNTVDAAAAVTEQGLFSQAATGGGTMFDRSVFSVINLASGDSLQTTYLGTFSSGG